MSLTHAAEVNSATRLGALFRPEAAAWVISLAVHAIAGGIFWQHLGRVEPVASKPMLMRASIRTLAPPPAPDAAATPGKSVQAAAPAPNRTAPRTATPPPIPSHTPPTLQQPPPQLSNATSDAAAPAPLAEPTAAAPAPSATIAATQPAAQMIAAAPTASTHQHVAGHIDAKYLHTPKPDYPPAARRRGLEGTVLIRVLISPDGIPGEARLLGPSGTDVLDQAALAAVLRWRFTPAREGNLAIEHWVDIPITFRLDGKT